MDYAPTTWRGALCVSIRTARPQAIVHLPSTSIWPFVMSVGFVFLFSGALIDSGWLALTGGLCSAVALVGWYWPSTTERNALADSREGRLSLPLGIAGALSNGWWGTWVLVLVLAVALVTIVACAFYLGFLEDAQTAPDGTAQLLAAVATSLAVLTGVATWWGGRGGVESQGARRRLGLTSGAGLDLVLLATLWLLYAYHETSSTREMNARGSILFLTLLFQAIVTVLHAVCTAVAAAWAWARPDDIRGLAPAGNVAVLSHFLAASWIVVFGVFYLSP